MYIIWKPVEFDQIINCSDCDFANDHEGRKTPKQPSVIRRINKGVCKVYCLIFMKYGQNIQPMGC